MGEVTSTGGSRSWSKAQCERELGLLLREQKERNVPSNLAEGDIVVSEKKISFGCISGSQNPVEKVIFVDKKKRPIPCSSEELFLSLPRVKSSETLLVMCRRDQADCLAIQDAEDLFVKWLEQTKQ